MIQPSNGKGRRNPDYPPNSQWDRCWHEWVNPPDAERQSEVLCKKCGCPGAVEHDGEVYWPAT